MTNKFENFRTKPSQNYWNFELANPNAATSYFKCTILSHLPLSPLSITVTCFDTKWFQRYNAAQVLIIDYSFNFFIIPYTTEIDISNHDIWNKQQIES